MFDDGPFQGERRPDCSVANPDQIFPIYGGNQLEVYGRSDSDPAPTVLLRTSAGHIAWCLYATGYDKTEVSSIRFVTYRRNPFAHPVVAGAVIWTYGHERTLWFINRDGSLVHYWYSW